MPAMQVASLVGDWDISEEFVNPPSGGRVSILEPNPRRFAFGVSVQPGQTCTLQFLNSSNGANVGIFLANGEFRWFDFHKHGTLVSGGWQVFNTSAVGIIVTVYELVQSPTAGE